MWFNTMAVDGHVGGSERGREGGWTAASWSAHRTHVNIGKYTDEEDVSYPLVMNC